MVARQLLIRITLLSMCIPSIAFAEWKWTETFSKNQDAAKSCELALMQAERDLWSSFDPLQKSVYERSGRTLYGEIDGCDFDSKDNSRVRYDAKSKIVTRTRMIPMSDDHACDHLNSIELDKFRKGVSTNIQKLSNFSPKIEVSECGHIGQYRAVTFKYVPRE